MKAIVNSAEEKKTRPFPKLMISNKGEIVFMLDDSGRGICLAGKDDNSIGDYAGFNPSDNWSMELFRDFEGTVTLSND